MQPLLRLLLASLALLPAPADRSEKTTAAWQAELRPDAAWDGQAQREWMRALLTRLDRANRVLMGPDEAAGHRSRYVALMRHAARGGRVSRSQLSALVSETDQREQQAVERLAREFRIRVYHTFRQQRGTFTRRRAAWSRVLADWEADGARFDQRDRLIDWLELALRASTPGTVAPLPADPEFGEPRWEPETDVALPGPRQPAAEGVVWPGPATLRPAADRPRRVAGREPPAPPIPADRPSPSPPRRAAEALSSVAQPVPPIPPMPTTRSAPVSPIAPLPAGFRRPGGVAPAPPRQPASAVPPDDRPARPALGTAAPIRLLAAEGSIPTGKQRRRAPRGTVGERVMPGTAASDLGQMTPAVPPSGLLPPPPSDAEHESGQPVPQTVEAQMAAVWLQDDVVPAVAQAAEPRRAMSSVRVNLDELSARIAGNNLALQALAAELDQQRAWSARELDPLVHRLSGLVLQKSDLEMFREVISPREQALVGRLESPRAVISQVGGRIFEARSRASGPAFAGTEAQRRAELEQLDRLSRKLAGLAAGKSSG